MVTKIKQPPVLVRPPRQGVGGKSTTPKPPSDASRRLSIMPIAKLEPRRIDPAIAAGEDPVSVGKLSGRANAVTRGQGQKVGLRAQFPPARKRKLPKPRA
jgi:hypothetical protein